MSIKLKDTILDYIDKAYKDSSGNTISSTYLKLSGGTISGQSWCPLIINNSSISNSGRTEVDIKFNIENVNKGYVGYREEHGIFIYNPSNYNFLHITDDGLPQFDKQTLWHAGNFTPSNYSLTSHTHTFASLTSKPTTVSGYGITDAITTGNIGSQSVASASLIKPVTGTGKASTWTSLTSYTRIWGESFNISSLGSDTGDIVFYLRNGVYTSNSEELCVAIDGDFYAQTGNKKVLHEGNYSSYAATASHTHSEYSPTSHNHNSTYAYVGGSNASGTWGISVTGTANSIAGFTKRGSGFTWGTLTTANGYTIVNWWDSTSGGGVGFSDKGGQTSIQIDGFFYQNEGKYLVLDSNNYSSYAATKNHTHSYLPLSGGTLSGPLEIKNSSGGGNYTEGLRITCASNNWAGITFGSTGLAGAPTNGWFAALNPSDQFIITPNDSSNTTGLTLNAGGDAKWRNYIILHAGNYNNYSPTLTGSGASGTWGISISGNAATATNATNARYVIADNNAQSPGYALLQSGSGRADASPGGDTWIYYDTLGGTSTPWGIKHEQASNLISFYGSGTRRAYIDLSNGNISCSAINGYTPITSGNIGSQSVNYASSAGNANTLDNIDSTAFLRQVVVPNNTTNDFNTFGNMTLTGRVDPTTGASLSNAPWSGSGPAGGYGVLTYLFNGSGYGTQMAWGYGSNRIYIRNRYYSSGIVWRTTWDSIALTSDIPSSLPANGGNADTVDGYHASSFAAASHGTHLSGNANLYSYNSSAANCNDVTYNLVGYYTSNGPATSLGATTNDGTLYSQAYSSSWVTQIAQDYRDGDLFTRGKNNGTWQPWKKVMYVGDDAASVDGHSFATVTSLPSSPNSSTVYFVTG